MKESGILELGGGVYIGVRGFPSRVILSLGALGPGSGPFPGLFVVSCRVASRVARHVVGHEELVITQNTSVFTKD